MSTPLMRPTIPVVIHRATDSTDYDEYGNPVEIVEDIETAAIRIAPVRGQEVSVNRQTYTVSYSAAFPPGADVRPEDRMTFYAAGEPKTLDVVMIFPVPCPRTNRVKYVRVDLTETEG